MGGVRKKGKRGRKILGVSGDIPGFCAPKLDGFCRWNVGVTPQSDGRKTGVGEEVGTPRKDGPGEVRQRKARTGGEVVEPV